MKKTLKEKKGFTLIELIIVIAIIAILATIILPRFANFTDSAKVSADNATITTINTQIEVYCAQEGINSLVGKTNDGVSSPIADGDSADKISDFLIEEGLLKNKPTFNGNAPTYNISINGLQ